MTFKQAAYIRARWRGNHGKAAVICRWNWSLLTKAIRQAAMFALSAGNVWPNAPKWWAKAPRLALDKPLVRIALSA